MKIVVLKFGGTSVGTIKKIKRVAKIIIDYKKKNYKIIVVSSAMSGVTNELIKKSFEISDSFSESEHDVLVSSGEQVACSLIAGRLIHEGYESRSWLSWQIPIFTEGSHKNSRIKKIYKNKITSYLKEDGIPIITGFQGINKNMRRANALILVVGILVLLVLVATAFITKTQSGRITSVAQRDSAQINDRNQSTMKAVADEIGDALFPRLIVPTLEASVGSANARRDDPNLITPRFGHDPSYPFNYAPFEVVPWTNPPDDTFNGIPLLGPENPLGGPSFGDARWLRDLEPVRADFVDFVGQGLSDWSGYEVDGTPETFTHWRHLSNLSRSGNSTRVVRNISDVVGNGLVTDLDVPIEQWPIWTPLKRNGNVNIGTTGYPTMDLMDLGDLNSGNWQAWGETNGQELIARYTGWQSLQGWAAAQLDPALLPPNFLDLSDLDGL